MLLSLSFPFINCNFSAGWELIKNISFHFKKSSVINFVLDEHHQKFLARFWEVTSVCELLEVLCRYLILRQNLVWLFHTFHFDDFLKLLRIVDFSYRDRIMREILLNFSEKMLCFRHRTTISRKMLFFLRWVINQIFLLLFGILSSLKNSLKRKIRLNRTKNRFSVVKWCLPLKFHDFFSSTRHSGISNLKVWSIITICIILIDHAVFLKPRFVLKYVFLLRLKFRHRCQIFDRLVFRNHRLLHLTFFIDTLG